MRSKIDQREKVNRPVVPVDVQLVVVVPVPPVVVVVVVVPPVVVDLP